MKNKQGKVFSFVFFVPKESQSYGDAYTFLILLQSHLISRAKGNNLRLSCIIHDSDITEEGEIKPLHLHAVVSSSRTMRISTALNLLNVNRYYNGISVHGGELTLNCAISADTGHNEIALTRYLVHLDNPEKFQYNADLDLFESTDESYFDYCLKAENFEIYDVTQLINLIEESSTYVEFICKLPVSYYRQNTYMINSLWNNTKGKKQYGN